MKSLINLTAFAAILAASAFFSLSCASSSGDDVKCEECDNVTTLLVGVKCVPIAQIAECGPDGHLHGSVCHCFHGQATIAIGGKNYCPQTECGQTSEVDVDAKACEHLTDTPEAVTPVESFAQFENAHVDLEKLAEISLPEQKESFVHFPGLKTTEYAVFVSESGVLEGFYDADNKALSAMNEGTNEDCPSDFKEAWHASVLNESGSAKPQIIKFKAGTAKKVKIFIIERAD